MGHPNSKCFSIKSVLTEDVFEKCVKQEIITRVNKLTELFHNQKHKEKNLYYIDEALESISPDIIFTQDLFISTNIGDCQKSQ